MRPSIQTEYRKFSLEHRVHQTGHSDLTVSVFPVGSSFYCTSKKGSSVSLLPRLYICGTARPFYSPFYGDTRMNLDVLFCFLALVASYGWSVAFNRKQERKERRKEYATSNSIKKQCPNRSLSLLQFPVCRPDRLERVLP